MPRPWTRSKKLRRACGGNPRAARTLHTVSGLVPRQDAGGSKEQADLPLGHERLTPPCRPRSKDPIDLSVRCGLPRTRSRRRPRAAGLQHRSYAASPRCDRNQNHSGRSRYSPPRSSRLAWRQGPQGSKQHLALAAPATRTRTQRPRKYLAIHAAELVVEPNFPILRRYRRSLLLRLEYAHRSAVENHVHRPPRLGSRRSLNLRIGIRGWGPRDLKEGTHVRVASSAFVETSRRSADRAGAAGRGATARPALVSGSGRCGGDPGVTRLAPGVDGRRLHCRDVAPRR